VRDSRPKRISNERFRERYEYLARTEDLTFADLAYRIGWVTRCSRTGNEKPDSSRVARTLGLVEETVRGVKRCRDYVSYKNALVFCEALHIDPWEVGL
jgi:hypothetical protein